MDSGNGRPEINRTFMEFHMKLALWRIAAMALIALNVSCSDKDAGEATANTANSASAQPVEAAKDSKAWLENWSKDTFSGKDPKELWQRYSDAVRSELKIPGADPTNLAAKAESLGHDPQKIFEFIRDQITLEPYAGLLRGARGTLMAGAGNAMDRALLAQELLKDSGIDSRLMKGSLSDAEADSLLKRYLAGDSSPAVLTDLRRSPDEKELTVKADELAGQAGISKDQARQLLHYLDEQNDRFWTKTNERREAQTDALSSRLKEGGVRMQAGGSAQTAELKSRLQEHYWLEVKDSNGAWSAFDPTAADGKRGTTGASGQVQLAEIPVEMYHRLEFSLIYRTVTDGVAKDEVLIDGVFPAAEALFAPLEFRVEPADASLDANPLLAMDKNQRAQALKNVKRFRPVLRAGSKAAAGRLFDLDGNTFDSGSSLLGNSGGSFFGDSLGGGEETNSPQFVDLRVTLKLAGPGRVTSTQTRTLVRAEDLMSATFAPPILGWEMLLQPQWISVQFVDFVAKSQAVAAGTAATKAIATAQTREFFAEAPPSAPIFLLQMALLRQRAAAEILESQKGVRALVEQPALTILGNGLTSIRSEDGQVVVARQIDIVENRIRFVAGDASAQSRTYEAALRQGVADCTIEDQYLREVSGDADISSGMTVVEQAQAERRPMRIVHVQDVDTLAAEGAAASEVEWIRDNEKASTLLVVATTAGGSTAWWSVSPDGNVVLRSDGGRGNVTGERSILETAQSYALGVVELGLALHCMYEVGAYLFEGYHENELPPAMEALNVVVCIAGTYTGYGFWATGAHAASEILMGLEIGWHGGQAMLHRVEGTEH